MSVRVLITMAALLAMGTASTWPSSSSGLTPLDDAEMAIAVGSDPCGSGTEETTLCHTAATQCNTTYLQVGEGQWPVPTCCEATECYGACETKNGVMLSGSGTVKTTRPVPCGAKDVYNCSCVITCVSAWVSWSVDGCAGTYDVADDTCG